MQLTFPRSAWITHFLLIQSTFVICNVHAFGGIEQAAKTQRLFGLPSAKQHVGAHLHLKSGSTDDEKDERAVKNFLDRRAFALVAAGMSTSLILSPSTINQASASIIELPDAMLVGTVSLPDDVVIDESSSSNPALYITCRPDRPDNVPSAILSGTRGKPPPVLVARFERPSFPFSFELVAPRDLTPEGASLSNGDYWWLKDDLVVSARWDSDGIAATRSPEDLVGRGIAKVEKQSFSSASISLSGRGAFGKFVTGGNK